LTTSPGPKNKFFEKMKTTHGDILSPREPESKKVTKISRNSGVKPHFGAPMNILKKWKKVPSNFPRKT